MMPFSILRVWTLGLIALGILAVASYLAWDWYRYDRQDEQLYWAVGIVGFVLLGRFVWMPFLGLGAAPPQLKLVDSKDIKGGDGTKIHVNILRNGAGPVAVLIHGWSLNSSVWSYLQRELSKNYAIMAPDLRGMGQSSQSPKNDYSIESMAGDLLEVLKLAGDRPVVLVGHSIGGMICQTFCRLYAAELGTRVIAIALCDTTYTNPLRTALLSPLWRTLQKPVIEPLLYLTIWLSPIVRLMNIQSYLNGTTQLMTRFSSFAGRQSWKQVDCVAKISSFASPGVVARGMLAMLRFDEHSTLTRINVPTAVIVGANDRLTSREASEHIADNIPGAKLVIICPGGHLGILERHESINEELSQFIDGVEKRLGTARVSA